MFTHPADLQRLVDECKIEMQSGKWVECTPTVLNFEADRVDVGEDNQDKRPGDPEKKKKKEIRISDTDTDPISAFPDASGSDSRLTRDPIEVR